MRAIWQGTDSYLLVSTNRLNLREKYYAYKMRIFARLVDKFASEHYAIGGLVERNLKAFGMKKPIVQFKTPINESLRVKRNPVDDKFLVLYYIPSRSKFREWLYGYDIYLEARSQLRDSKVRFIVVHGKHDMKAVYRIADFMIRPNRHDGIPRMVSECQMNGIPYYWSDENPNLHDMLVGINIAYAEKFKEQIIQTKE